MAPLLRDYVIVGLFSRFGAEWWQRCHEVNPEPVREKYTSEAKVRGNSDPVFWIKVMELFWEECFDDRLGPAERSAVTSLRHYRNHLSHDSSKLSPHDIYQALLAIRLVLRKIAPSSVLEVDSLLLGLRVQHPACTF